MPIPKSSAEAEKMLSDLEYEELKENKLEKATREFAENTRAENQNLGTTGRIITTATDVVAGMGPTIATNAVLPGAGMATLYTGAMQQGTENALAQGATPEQALEAGVAKGAVELGTEMIGGEKIKEIHGCKSRCIMRGASPLTGKCVVCGNVREGNDFFNFISGRRPKACSAGVIK